jgi:TatD DNase family protein
MFDTHTHLDDPRFEADSEQVIERAAAAGVRRMITVGAGLDSCRRAVKIAEVREGIRASVGVHPHDAAALSDPVLNELRQLAGSDRVAAVGEIGLDYYRNLSPRDTQREAFRRQIELAVELGLPVIVHNREARDDCLEILRAFDGRIRGVAHCFSGDADTARAFLDLGFYISFSGSVTFPNARNLAAVAAIVPEDRILAETDCPYLAPQQVRGSRNEPAFLRYVVEKLSEIRGVTIADMARITTENAEELFLGALPIRKPPV